MSRTDVAIATLAAASVSPHPPKKFFSVLVLWLCEWLTTSKPASPPCLIPLLPHFAFHSNWCTADAVKPAFHITPLCGMETVVNHGAANVEDSCGDHLSHLSLPSIPEPLSGEMFQRASSALKDSPHPSHTLFDLLPSGGRYLSMKSRNFPLLLSRCTFQLF